QPEILEYFEQFAKDVGLLPHLQLDTPVHGARGDDAHACWRGPASRGDGGDYVLIRGGGLFGNLNCPDIPGPRWLPGTLVRSARCTCTSATRSGGCPRSTRRSCPRRSGGSAPTPPRSRRCGRRSTTASKASSRSRTPTRSARPSRSGCSTSRW